jgi:hypothetical protein
MSGEKKSLSKVHEEFLADHYFFDQLSLILFDYSLKIDLSSIKFGAIIEHLDKAKIEKKGITMSVVKDAFRKAVISKVDLFDTKLRIQMCSKIMRIRNYESRVVSKINGTFLNVHTQCLQSKNASITDHYILLRYGYPNFYKENLDKKAVLLFLKEVGFINPGKYNPARYFFVLEKYLKYSEKVFRNYNPQKSIWTVKKK